MTEQAFFALVRAGLWEKDVRLASYGEIDFMAILGMAKEQSVVGLIAAGIEHIVDARPRKMDVLPFIGRVTQLEQSNKRMNGFIEVLVEKMSEAGVSTVLVKGQGVAQCYERPLWRSCGDVDFFLDDENYERAKVFLRPLTASVEEEYVRERHLGMTIDSWVVELHGRLYSGLSENIERELDEVYRETFLHGNVRCWKNGKTDVPLMAVENDVFYVFTHILQHFYKGGIGLRQICDWCRLLAASHIPIHDGRTGRVNTQFDITKLEGRLRRAGLMTAWRAFAAFAVEYLGMEAAVMPFYSDAAKWKRKASRIRNFVMSVGNMGHNRDMSHYDEYPYMIRKCISMGQRIGDLISHARIFPLDSLRFSFPIMWNGVRSMIRGELHHC